MRNFRLLILAAFIFSAAFPAPAQKSDAGDWSIADYLQNLPEKYKTFSGDFHPVSQETTIIDEQNGYAAYLSNPFQTDSENPPFPIFEAAIFKGQTKTPLLVVSNKKMDSVCTDYETFYLRRVGSVWTEVRLEVLPALVLNLFWDKPQSAARFLKIVERDNATSFHFEPPREGTQMKVSLEICDYFLEVTPIKQVDELRKIIESAKPLYLTWDKQTGKFKLAK